MEIQKASKLGFCFGVEEAINLVNEIILKNQEKQIYIIGMLVHNEKVILDLEKKGVIFLGEEKIEDLKENDIVIIRAHGTSKKIYEKLKMKKVKIYDAACIFVKKSRELLENKTNEGYKIIFLGDKYHPEVSGIISYGDKVEVYPDLKKFESEFQNNENEKYFMIFQTTFNNQIYEEIVNYVKSKYKNIEIGKTICGATYERQNAVKELAKKVELVIVIGGKKSSNTYKLYEISKKINENTILVESADEINAKILSGIKKIGITAGASTPKESIKEIEIKINTIMSEEESK